MQMEVETLAKQVEQQQGRIQVLEDEQAIQKLETAYAYFIEHLMVDEITDCWADGGAMVWVGLGIYRDKPAIRKLWQTVKEHFLARGETRHLGPRISPYVTVAPDGKTANARWYVAGTPLGASMLCENTYVKQDGVWKIDVMNAGAFPLDPITLASIAASSAVGPDAALAASKAEFVRMTPEEEEKQTQEYMGGYPFSERIPRTPRQEYGPYLRPFSFKHPVTGKDVNETVAAHNAANPCPMPPGGEKWTAKDQA
jgi:hypothetical protein